MLIALIRKDLFLLFRASSLTLSVGFFALLLVVLASFAFRRPGFGPGELQVLLPGVFWMVFLFVSVVLLHQSFAPEEENQAMAGLLLYGVSPELVYLSKLLGNWLFLFLLHTAVIVFSVLFFGVGLRNAFPSLLALSFGVSLGIAALGTMLSAISSAVRGRELLLPVLLFPLCLPLLLAAVTASDALIAGTPLSQLGFPLVLISVFDVLVITLALIFFEPLMLE